MTRKRNTPTPRRPAQRSPRSARNRGTKKRDRRERGSLTRDEIAATALELLDRDGLELVTVRQIAEALDVGVMSLYVHMENKEEIIQAAADLVLAEMPEVDATAAPRTAVIAFFETFHREMLAHPSVAHVIASRPVLGPATFASMDSLFRTITGSGIAVEEAVRTVTVLMSYTLGFALFSIARDRADAHVAKRRDQGLRGVDPDAFPALYEARNELLRGAFDVSFTDGLTRLVHAYVPART